MQDQAPLAQTRPSPAEIIAGARAISRNLRARSAAAEAARRCPDETIAEARDIGFLRCVQPTRYGGYGMDWDVLCEAAMELGAGCGGQAWAAMVIADHPCVVGMFEDQAQHDVWGKNPETYISTSYGPRGTVTRVPGGYRLTGKWSFSSGIEHTHWTVCGGFVERDDGTKQHHFFLVPAADRTIIDDWHVMGMAASGSLSFELKDAFVPEHRALNGALVRDGEQPGGKVHKEALHRMPIFGFTGTVLVSVVIGVAMGMVRDFEAMLKAKATPKLAGVADLQDRLAMAGSEVECAKLLTLNSARRNLDVLKRGGKLTEGDGAETQRDSSYAAKLCKQAATRLMEGMGGSGLALSSDMQRAFRDVYAGASHTTLNWGRSVSRYGEHLLGWPSSQPF